MPKTLIVFYSRTGTTKKVATNLAQSLNADMEEIMSVKNRQGAWGYLFSGKEAARRLTTEIAPLTKNPADYDLVIIGTPIWSFNMSSLVRTYLENNKSQIKQAAFFCTMGGSGDTRAFAEMEQIINQKPKAVIALKTRDVVAGQYSERLEGFIKVVGS
jgi:flavodoxin